MQAWGGEELLGWRDKPGSGGQRDDVQSQDTGGDPQSVDRQKKTGRKRLHSLQHFEAGSAKGTENADDETG